MDSRHSSCRAVPQNSGTFGKTLERQNFVREKETRNLLHQKTDSTFSDRDFMV